MPTLNTIVDGLKLPNPFVIGSGPPGTNLNVLTKAFQEGWGAVVAKTISLDASKVVNRHRAGAGCGARRKICRQAGPRKTLVPA